MLGSVSLLMRASAGVGACLLLASGQLVAQRQEMMTTPLGISMDRMGSGTTWIPDAAPIASAHGRLAGWDITSHGLIFAQYIRQGGPRGDDQFGSLNWGMLMASRGLAGGMLQLRTMLSLDPGTVTGRGYPMLLQSGESFAGEPLHDRQHPHDFWMELGVLYLRPVARHVALELYLAPSGEPALGPVAFMHRPSAIDDPIAPLGHHWQDATHISFGVVTAGIFSHRWKLEGSLFNGREPDEHRWDFDFDRLDSWSTRLSYNSRGHWNLTAGYGRLKQEAATLHRLAASVMHGSRLGQEGQLASSLIYGANVEPGGKTSHSVLLESEAILDRSNTLFGRVEWVQKSSDDLAIPQVDTGLSPDPLFNVFALSAGYVRDVVRGSGLTLGLGVRGSVGFVPEVLEPYYATRTPLGGAIFLRLRPVRQHGMEGMPGMRH
jgi:hypothetical protein